MKLEDRWNPTCRRSCQLRRGGWRGRWSPRRLRRLSVLITVGVAVGAAFGGWLAGSLHAGEKPTVDRDGFRLALAGYDYRFPFDHGSHPDFRIEWWYITGHLFSEDEKRRFGFQATFFRNGIKPPSEDANGSREGRGSSSTFGGDHAYLAHMAVVDIASGEFIFEERLNRSGWDADAAVGDLDVRNGNWSLRRVEGQAAEGESPDTFELVGTVLSETRFRLRLEAAKPLVLFGEDGISRKAEAHGAASHYITHSRLLVTGGIEWRGESVEVKGQAWMDHEISSSQLGDEQVGWDWASIQLDDGREVMAYLMRTRDGGFDPYSKLTWIDEEGRLEAFGPDAFRWTARRQWTSPTTGVTYPIDIDLELPDPQRAESRTLRLRPLLDAQEISGELGGIAYWEGACDVVDASGAVVGKAFVELAGYDGRLNDALRAATQGDD